MYLLSPTPPVRGFAFGRLAFATPHKLIQTLFGQSYDHFQHELVRMYGAMSLAQVRCGSWVFREDACSLTSSRSVCMTFLVWLTAVVHLHVTCGEQIQQMAGFTRPSSCFWFSRVTAYTGV